MVEKTHVKDAEGWARVIQALKDQGHKFPHAYVASHVGVSRQSVRQWCAVPLEHLATVSEISGIPRQKILPAKFKLMKELMGE
jgi:hypothetical protein